MVSGTVRRALVKAAKEVMEAEPMLVVLDGLIMGLYQKSYLASSHLPMTVQLDPRLSSTAQKYQYANPAAYEMAALVQQPSMSEQVVAARLRPASPAP